MSGRVSPPEPAKRRKRQEHRGYGEPTSPADGFARIADDLDSALAKRGEGDSCHRERNAEETANQLIQQRRSMVHERRKDAQIDSQEPDGRENYAAAARTRRLALPIRCVHDVLRVSLHCSGVEMSGAASRLQSARTVGLGLSMQIVVR